MTAPTALAIVGVGKIARDQHLPSIARNPAFDLVAAASRNARLDGVENFTTAAEMFEAMPGIEAVALCMPPQARHAIAADALGRGKHVLLEKPPGATLSEINHLAHLAEACGVSLFATWHSRFAPGVEPARDWLAGKSIRSVRVDWMEDVRHWHPGQDWIWEPGGLGVFDPGINALSIVTRILPEPVWLTSAELSFPENRAAPIAARLRFEGGSDLTAEAIFDWRQTGPQTWDIAVETDEGKLVLSAGGATLAIDGAVVSEAPEAEYDGIYARFAELIAKRQSDVDISPLRHVADAFMLGRRQIVEPFHDHAGDGH
ncbi:MAG: Gfo/Idh/MocA family oxidoreductase [Aurantimonas endophytica]|uniref:D-galactose 1-dehydrogenase n=1 Tax=Aurantimonas endophytica TaxID=1522175 RepID=A0A7W6HEA7_9HYPH|nr:Gfo/Idh/MocA family oxidoreductase [Aurantimonas endophytica]MBB4003517.1 D-galactose 1-dehydrogenase [Aurantimonas endophytica]MCO6404376.1 Gfo/Idh/MocA family oxidoreductase [Aurantimonas endophytica]